MLKAKAIPMEDKIRTDCEIEGEGRIVLLEYEKLTSNLFETFSDELDEKEAFELLQSAFANGLKGVSAKTMIDVLLDIFEDGEKEQ